MLKHLKLSKDYCIQNIIGLVVIIAVALILWPLAPKPNPNVSGILLPSAPLKPAISPEQVQILQAMPPKAQILGTINTTLHYDSLSLAEERLDMNATFNYAKFLAAQAGANGVVIQRMGTTPQGPLDGFVLQASAVSY